MASKHTRGNFFNVFGVREFKIYSMIFLHDLVHEGHVIFYVTYLISICRLASYINITDFIIDPETIGCYNEVQV